MQAFSFKFHNRKLLEKRRKIDKWKSIITQAKAVAGFELLSLVKSSIFNMICTQECKTLHCLVTKCNLPNLSADTVKKQSSTGLITTSTTLGQRMRGNKSCHTHREWTLSTTHLVGMSIEDTQP